MTVTKLSVSVPSELLVRADQVLTRPGEGRSALIARILSEAIRAAEEAEIDAAYERVYAAHSPKQEELEHTDAVARAAVRSTRRTLNARGAPI